MKYVVYFFAVIGFLFLLMLAFSAYQFSRTDVFEDVKSSFAGDHFGKYVHYQGGIRDGAIDLQALPSGDGELYGFVTLNGKPLPGMSIELTLNEKYLVESVITDEQGRYSIKLPAGEWKINTMMLDKWKDKPAGEFVVRTGQEEKLDKSFMYYGQTKNKSNFNVEAGQSVEITSVDLTEVIAFVSPNTDDEELVVDDPDEFTIRWLSHPEASEYQVSVWSVTKNSNGTSSSSLDHRVVNSAEIKLLDFDLVNVEESAQQVYSVEIKGFDKEGSFVSNSQYYPSHKFTLQGYEIVNNKDKELLESLSLESIKKLRDNNVRLDYAKLLIKEESLLEAEKVLKQVSGEHDKGKLNALKGYLNAKQGNCTLANDFFDLAVKQKGKTCVPAEYRRNCQK